MSSRVRQYGNEKSLLASALINLKDAATLLAKHLEVDEKDAIKVLTTNEDKKKEASLEKKRLLEKRKSRIRYLEERKFNIVLKDGKYRICKVVKIKGAKKRRLIGIMVRKTAKLYVRIGDKFKLCKSLTVFVKRVKKEAQR